jgi:hypothetical protein
MFLRTWNVNADRFKINVRMFAHLDLQIIFNLICDFGTEHIQNQMIPLILRMLRQFHMLCVEAVSGIL